MHVIKSTLLLILFFSSQVSHAYIPPVPIMLKEIFADRKPGTAFEVVFTHQVKLAVDSDAIVIQERIVREKSRYTIFWKLVSDDRTVPAYWTGKEYRLPDKKTFPSDTKLFMRVFLAMGFEELQSALLNEKFLNKGQLVPFKTGYSFEGDPNLWNLKDNYVFHPDISVKRTPNGPAFAVTGFEEGKSRRTFYIDRTVRGMHRLEWETESGITAWNFGSYGPQALGGLLPKKFTFESASFTLVESRLNGTRVLTAQQVHDIKKTFDQLFKDEPSLPSSMENALKLLLSFR